jgi:hypothetical protein
VGSAVVCPSSAYGAPTLRVQLCGCAGFFVCGWLGMCAWGCALCAVRVQDDTDEESVLDYAAFFTQVPHPTPPRAACMHDSLPAHPSPYLTVALAV